MINDYEDIWDDDDDNRSCASSSSSSRGCGCDEVEQRQMILMEKGLVNVEEESGEFKMLKKSFLKGMEYMEKLTDLLAVHKNDVSCEMGRKARWDSFRMFSEAVGSNCGGNANVKYAWYVGSCLEELLEIVSSGFSICRITNNTNTNTSTSTSTSTSTTQDQEQEDDSHGLGIHLFPAKFSLDAAMRTVGKEDGSRHMLLCRVILGKVEAVGAGSKQSHPSSDQYNSGVDHTCNPTKYIIWTAFMNSHIHPHYIITFKFSPSHDCPLIQNPSYPLLLAKLSKHLEPSQMVSLVKGYRQCQEGKISKRQWSLKMRKIIGNRLLASIIKNEYALA
ncbi:putative inactive poly [ADP-ribose] polymerase SRO2 isoform X2 [Senna tora]|uniref:Putative inactive poly [ADP-ribose] polymerase SRO2 isoform X2 n=1 Tax=Senna tora TaxID=362788 RepID=A0A834SU69_9FABA|nr:putative inactive poly [ADP-ribose] polymerase SRO2 isoform X2 [Senna tora]